MIKLINVNKIYKNKLKVLDDINLNILAGEFVSIVGQSGTGKTTLVKILIGEELATSGKVVIGGWDITKIGKREVPYLNYYLKKLWEKMWLLPWRFVEKTNLR